MPVQRYSSAVREAAALLGAQVRQQRIARDWTVRGLAERAGISPRTLLKVEHGDPSVALGTAFEVASIVGVPLFYDDERRVAAEAERGRAAVLNRRVRVREDREAELDF